MNSLSWQPQKEEEGGKVRARQVSINIGIDQWGALRTCCVAETLNRPGGGGKVCK